MKYLLPLFFCSCGLLTAARAAAEDTDICAKVTCGNHGNCIVKTDGNPVCACHEGYSPDASTGLSCLPISSPKAASEAKPVAKPATKQEPKAKQEPQPKHIPPPPPDQQCSVDEHCKHYTVCYEGLCIDKTKKKQYLEWSNMPLEAKTKKANNMIIAGSVVVGVGGAVTIVGCINFFVGAFAEDESIFKSGFVLAPIGMVTVIVGAAVLSVGTKLKKHPTRNTALGLHIPTNNSEIILEPIFAVGENSGLFGLSGRF